MIELKNISKKYPGGNKYANKNISLELKYGEILCIAGENGAGKTTLMNILIGLVAPDSGEIFINGKKEVIASPLAAKKLGIGMVHQHFMLFGEYTAAQNIVMGAEPRKLGIFYDLKRADEIAKKILSDNNFSVKSSSKVKELTLGEMQQVEICRLLYRNAKIIILDEPTSILTEQESRSLFNTVKTLSTLGKSVVLITHKLSEIKQVCDRVAVLRRGELAGILEGDAVNEYDIACLMQGTGDRGQGIVVSNFKIKQHDMFSINNSNPQSPVPRPLSPVISFEKVTVRRHRQKLPLLDDVSFTVNSGEILGFTGVGGNGLGVIEAVLGGFLHPAQGKILYRGKDISHYNIRHLRKEGLSFVPADRMRVGSAGVAAIDENMIINRRYEFFRRGIINRKTVKEFCEKFIQNYNIDAASARDNCLSLSGGNLQKLILAREIDWFRDYIVFSEPTWGLDIASSGFIINEINNLRKKGAAVILISTNLDEILALSDRIIVMYRGMAAGLFKNGEENVRNKVALCMQAAGNR